MIERGVEVFVCGGRLSCMISQMKARVAPVIPRPTWALSRSTVQTTVVRDGAAAAGHSRLEKASADNVEFQAGRVLYRKDGGLGLEIN